MSCLKLLYFFYQYSHPWATKTQTSFIPSSVCVFFFLFLLEIPQPLILFSCYSAEILGISWGEFFTFVTFIQNLLQLYLSLWYLPSARPLALPEARKVMTSTSLGEWEFCSSAHYLTFFWYGYKISVFFIFFIKVSLYTLYANSFWTNLSFVRLLALWKYFIINIILNLLMLQYINLYQ